MVLLHVFVKIFMDLKYLTSGSLMSYGKNQRNHEKNTATMTAILQNRYSFVRPSTIHAFSSTNFTQ